MAIVNTVTPREGFIVQMGGDYNLPFDEVEVNGTFASGTILENATTEAGADSDTILGILAEDVDGQGYARVMVRGNPTSVNAQALPNYDAAMKPMLEKIGIIVVND